MIHEIGEMKTGAIITNEYSNESATLLLPPRGEQQVPARAATIASESEAGRRKACQKARTPRLGISDVCDVR